MSTILRRPQLLLRRGHGISCGLSLPRIAAAARPIRALCSDADARRASETPPVQDTSAGAAPSSLQPDWSPPVAPRLGDCSPRVWIAIYGELAKSRLSGLVVATTFAGYLMAPTHDWVGLTSALGGTFLCASSANSFNQLMEVRNDAAMNRTAKRPLPSGRISPMHAAGWATGAGAAGLTTLVLGTDYTTTALGAATLGLYTLAYTPMKQRSPLNTWVGAVVGAIPPVMGWTAGGGR